MRVLTWPLPGQRFWLAWCGGVNLLEALLFLFLMGTIAAWTEYFVANGYKYYDAGA